MSAMVAWNDETIDWYVAKHGDHRSIVAVVDAIPFRGEESVLDLGCGSGSALRAMAQRTKGQLVGIDPFDRMLNHARKAGTERINYHVAGAEDLPFEDASFDVVTAINSTPHWSDLVRGIHEAIRVLRSKGLLVIGGEGFTEPNMLAEQPYQAALEDHGFHVERIALSDGAFAVLARKGRA